MYLQPISLRCFKRNIRNIVKGAFAVVLIWIAADVLFPVNKGLYKHCELHDMDLFDKSLDKYFWREKKVNCSIWKPLMGFDSKGYLQILYDNVKSAGHINVNCAYSFIIFSGLNDVVLSESIPFHLPIYIKDDFINVNCYNENGENIYRDLLFKIHSSVNNRSSPLHKETSDQLSIVILGLDSVSRFIAERELPMSLKYLKETLGAHILEGYTKIGDNTLPNLIAMLLGKSIPELFLSAFQVPDIMKKISEMGYIDCQAEDWAPYIPFLGFKYPYYSHFLRRFILAKDKVPIFLKNNISKHMKMTLNPLCFGVNMKHNIVMEYGKMYLETYRNYRKFLFLWMNEIGHHQPNQLQLADADIKQFLEWLHSANRMERSILLVVSDHGPRYSQVLKSHIGRFTGRLPLLAIVLPQKLKDSFPHLHKNMMTNIKRLTTPFDVHEMIMDIMNHNFEERHIQQNYLTRGISLFNEIPITRTCYDAGISEHYCPCYTHTDISTESTNVTNAALFIIESINSLLEKAANKCAKLFLRRIIDAKLIHSTVLPVTADEMLRYTLVVQTFPGDGVFEASVRHLKNKKFELLGDINRNNMYGNQSNCIKDLLLKLYCFCVV